MIWAGFGFMTLIAVMFAAWPLLAKGKGVVATEDGTSAVLVDKLDEVKRDHERGVISEGEADAARMEIKRRILALSRKTSDAGPQSAGDGNAAMYLAALFVPILAIGYYSINGTSVSSNRALEALQTEREEEQKIADLAQKLFERLTSEPNGGQSDGWMLLGQTYMRMGKHSDAVQAFDVITRREGATSETWSRLAEALVMAEAGIVTPRAQSAIDQAFRLDPANPAAAFYMAVSLEQAGETKDAHDLLISRLNEAEGFAPWMETFVAKANRIGSEIGRAPENLASFAPIVAGPGPSADDVAAAGDMTEEDRSAFIRSMVERLASRLEDEPDDLEGWMRLANAYTVLGERDNAVSAYEKASALLQNAPETDPRRQRIERALSELKG